MVTFSLKQEKNERKHRKQKIKHPIALLITKRQKWSKKKDREKNTEWCFKLQVNNPKCK